MISSNARSPSDAATSQFGARQFSIAESEAHRAEHVDVERCLIGVGYLGDERGRALAAGCVAVGGKPVDLASRGRGQPHGDRPEERGTVAMAGNDGADGELD